MDKTQNNPIVVVPLTIFKRKFSYYFSLMEEGKVLTIIITRYGKPAFRMVPADNGSSLDKLVEQITPENVHEEISTGRTITSNEFRRLLSTMPNEINPNHTGDAF